MLIRNPLDGTPTNPITAVSSAAGGTAFDSVTGSPTYDSTLVKSGTSGQFTTTAAATVSCNWIAALGGTYARLAGCVYFSSTSFSAANMIVRLRDGTGNQIARIVTDTSGHVVLRINTGNTLVGTGSVAMSTGTNYRIEWDITSGAAAPVAVYVYLGDSTTLLDSVTSASANSGSANIAEVNWGIFTNTASVPAFQLDEPAVSDAAGLIGPLLPTPRPILSSLYRPTLLPARAVISRSSLVDVVVIPPGAPAPVVSTVAARPAIPARPLISRSSLVDVPVPPPGAPAPLVVTVSATPRTPARAVVSRAPIIPVPGEPLLPGTLPSATVVVEAAFGADLTTSSASWSWTDLTGLVMYETGVSITQGRADETSQASPAQCSFTLDNTTGDFTPYCSTSPYWPYVRRNTPIRVSVDLGTGPQVRFLGYSAGWPPSWDISAERATVAVSASGLLRRLTQGKTPVLSPMQRVARENAAQNVPLLLAWDMTDPSTATEAASTIVGRSPLRVTAGTVTFGTESTLYAASSVATLANNTAMQALTPLYNSTGEWSLNLWAQAAFTATNGATQIRLADLVTPGGTVASARLTAYLSPARYELTVYDSTGALLATVDSSTTGVDPLDGSWHNAMVRVENFGSAVKLDLIVDGTTSSTTLAASTNGSPTSITLRNRSIAGDSGPVNLSTIALWADATIGPYYQAGIGYDGETASDRISRLCGEQGVTVAVTGSSATLMGPQPDGAFVDLLRVCEAADGGLLYDGFTDGLGYICRSARYNPATAMSLDMAADPPEVAAFAPADDDQRIRNDQTVSATIAGTTVSDRFVDTDGPLGTDAIGTYDSEADLNLNSADALLDQAAWQVHLGTVEGLRYPALGVNLLAVPTQAASWLGVALCGRVDVLNVTSRATQHPAGTVSVFVEGWTETLFTFGWDAALNCSAEQPWEVFQLESATRGRLGTTASELAAAVSPTDTTLSVSTPAGAAWATTASWPADFPFDVVCDLEQITVTAVVGAGPTQSFTVTRSVNGVSRSHDVGAAVSLWHPTPLAL